MIESQSVRRGHGRFGAPPSQTTQGRSVVAVVSETAHETEVEREDEEEDLNDASAIYSVSTNLARSTTTVELDNLTRTHTPLPTTEWGAVGIPVPNPINGLPSKPIVTLPLPTSRNTRTLAERIGSHFHNRDGGIGETRPLIERIGGLYVPPNARAREYRDDLGFWQYPTTRPSRRFNHREREIARDDDDFWQSQRLVQIRKDEGRATWWQSEIVRRQRINLNRQSPSHPGPSRRCLLQPTFSQVAVLFHSLGEKLISLRLWELEVRDKEGIEGVEYVGSYKWIESETGPTLAVPGNFSSSLGKDR